MKRTKKRPQKSRTIQRQRIQIPTDRLDYCLDTEFIEDGTTIDLVSIAVVSDDDRTFYACNTDAKLHLASDWVRKNVLPQLPSYDAPEWMPRDAIAIELYRFTDPLHGRLPPRFWGYYADYDWVAVCQLYGRMLDLPGFFQKYCWDLKQYSTMLGSPEHPPDPENAHHALADAYWNRRLLRMLRSL